MPGRLGLSSLTRAAVTVTVALAGAAGVTIVMPALAAGTHHSKPASHRQAGQTQLGHDLIDATVFPPEGAPSGGWHPRLSPASLTRAVTNCVMYATRAGWPNNGYFGGDLVTAAAICVAESAGDPNLIVCDDADGNVVGHGDFPGFTCPAGTDSFDRGLWQLNSKHASKVTDKCAFNPVCNADQAYIFSNRGTSFVPWTSYDQDTYAAPFLDRVQQGVTNLSGGTVTSAVLGECMSEGRRAAGAKVIIANCGKNSNSPIWKKASHGRLTGFGGANCLAIANHGSNPAVVLQRCAVRTAQEWSVFGRSELRNAADGKCLTDPGSSLETGTVLDVTACVNAKDQTWFLP
ncbi:MAG TPA: ricin-type beta-trefoil lectin domain protein [Streptosporangiaceae bacterium]|nr:ricin-type beta-trefoil lectin domain protein [Streptosporangiaceae bacterium]